MGNKAVWAMLARPVIRASVSVIVAFTWFQLWTFLYWTFLDTSTYFKTVFVTNPGLDSNTVWFTWAWAPFLFIIVFFGIFWASGILARFGRIVGNL